MKKVLSRQEPAAIDDAIAAGAVPLLAVLLDANNAPATQFAAMSALSSIAGGTTEQAACVATAPDVIANFVRLLGSANTEVASRL
jgi:hypothetical protein